MARQQKPAIFYQGKRFNYMFHYADLGVYGRGDLRLMIEPDGKPFGIYEFNSKKSFQMIH